MVFIAPWDRPGYMPHDQLAADHFAQGQAQRLRQALAAVLDVMGQARPAAFDELLVGFLEAGRGLTPDSLQVQPSMSPTRFSGASTCSQNFAPSSRIASTMSGRGVLASRQALIVRLIAKQFVTNEANITQGGFVIRHCDEPLGDVLGGDQLLATPVLSNSCLKHTFSLTYVKEGLWCHLRHEKWRITPRLEKPPPRRNSGRANQKGPARQKRA